MKSKIFILIPADVPSGPVKGAYALANSLVEYREVSLVTLKEGEGAEAALNSNVKKISLSDMGNFFGKLKAYRKMLSRAGGREHVASISMCFSADVLNSFCAAEAVTCSSVRGNLTLNYRMDYGVMGLVLAAIHLLWLKRVDRIVAMTLSMSQQVERYSRCRVDIIGNFVDEFHLEKYRKISAKQDSLRFIFIGSLSKRKMPSLLIDAIVNLADKGLCVHLDILGEGPLYEQIESQIEHKGLQHLIKMHGFVASPYELLSSANAMVLPSLSEGISRASLESLYLGVPCVLRNSDGNSELIDEKNGALFLEDSNLVDAMLVAGRLSQCAPDGLRPNLLPCNFQRKVAVTKYLELIE